MASPENVDRVTNPKCPHGHIYGTCLMCYHDLVAEQQSEIERLRGNLSMAEEGLANYALEVKQLTGDRAQDQQRLFHYEGAIAEQRAAIEQLHAAVRTAQELAARRLMEIERLRAECDRLLKRGDKAELELSSLKHYYTLAARNTSEPSEQRSEVNSIDDVAAICHSVTGLCCHILGSPGGPCTIGNCAAVRGYLGGPEFAQGASRDASSESYPAFMYCPKCGELYTGRGGTDGLQMTLTCPNQHSWTDPRPTELRT